MSFRSISENLNAYREEAGSHPVALDRVLGFTFIRAWVYLMFVGAAASSMTWSGEQIPPLFYVVSTASLCAVLFGSALAEEPESEAESAEDRALASSSDVPPAASDNPRPRFQDRCLEVAAAFELSPKETEVMILFAKGRSAARIQEELFISKGTVSTHLRHIYQKMDVHSKQEMLDVIEGVTRE